MSFRSGIRRVFSGLGAAYFALALLVPMLAAFQAESKLPVCCRRGGVHHCAMGTGFRLNIGNAAGVAGNQRCPQFPSAMAAAQTQAFTLSGSQWAAQSLLPVAVLQLRNAEASRIARTRQLQLRGPPAVQSA